MLFQIILIVVTAVYLIFHLCYIGFEGTSGLSLGCDRKEFKAFIIAITTSIILSSWLIFAHQCLSCWRK